MNELTPLRPFFKLSSMNNEIYSGALCCRLMKLSNACGPTFIHQHINHGKRTATGRTPLIPLSSSLSLWNDMLHILSKWSFISKTSCTHFSASVNVCAAAPGARPLPLLLGPSSGSSSSIASPARSTSLLLLISCPRRMIESRRAFRSAGRPVGTKVKRRYIRSRSSSLSRSIIASSPEGMLMIVEMWGVMRLSWRICRRGRIVCDERKWCARDSSEMKRASACTVRSR